MHADERLIDDAAAIPATVTAPGRRERIPCAPCHGGAGHLVFGQDRDGLVLCRDCGAPLFYCDIGGQG